MNEELLNDAQAILRDCNLGIQPGATVALAGPTGLAEEVTDIEEMLSYDEFAARIRKGNPKASEAGLKKMYAAYKRKVAEAMLEDADDELDEVVKRRSLKSRLAAAKKRGKPMDAKRKAKAKAAKLWRQKNKAKIKSYKKRYKAPIKSVTHRESIEQAVRAVAEGGDVQEAVQELITDRRAQ
jgi:hypothetical protein